MTNTTKPWGKRSRRLHSKSPKAPIVSLKLASENAAQAETARAVHQRPFNTVIKMIMRSASSRLATRGEAAAIRRQDERTKL
jgi:hypothetical protein